MSTPAHSGEDASKLASEILKAAQLCVGQEETDDMTVVAAVIGEDN